MSASEATLTPHFPTSPSASGWSGSLPINVGRSNATLRPVPPADNRAWYRWLVSSGVPKPENCRIVQSFPPYPSAWIPRV